MIDYLSSFASQLGASMVLVILLLVWEGTWTAIAMWKAAKNGDMFWFIFFFLVNLFGIPEIIYIFFFSKSKRSGSRKR